MKKLVLGLGALLFTVSMMAQNINDYMEVERAALKTGKKAIVAEAMQLTEGESTAFWPLYNEYNDKMYLVNTKVYNNIMDYADNFESMTDEKAIALYNNAMAYEKEMDKLEKSYFKKFQKILPGKKAVRYFQVENKISMLINAEIASEIPLVEE